MLFRSGWQRANVVAPPGGALASALHEPERVVETIPPVLLAEPQPGTFVFDFGRNMSGWARLRVRGALRQIAHNQGV